MKFNRKGFTLIELVITMLVLVIVFGMLASIVGFATRFYSDESSQVHRQEALRLFAVNFEKDIRHVVEHELYFEASDVGGIKTFNLGEPASANLITYTFNSNSADGRVYRTQNAITSTVATDINDVSITLNTSGHPSLHFVVEGMPDGRETENRVEVKIYLRVLTEGG